MMRYEIARGAHRVIRHSGAFHNRGLGAIIFIAVAVAIAIGAAILIAWLVHRHERKLTAMAAGAGTGAATVAGTYGGGASGYGPTPSGGAAAVESPVDILKARYARGEIDKPEFEEKLKDLS